METLNQDIRFAFRMLVKNPGFTAAVIVCLMLGIGATTAIFSVVNSVLLRPLPYREPDKLVRVYSEFPKFQAGGLHRFWLSPPEFLDLRRDSKSWQTLDGWVNGGANLAGTTNPVRATACFISGTTLLTLGVSPLLGRLITPEDDDPKSPVVMDISYGIWKSVFGGEPSIINREVLLNGQKATVVGVMPEGFAFPPGEIDPPQVWSPLQIDPAKPGGRGSHFLYLLGRLKDGVSRQQAQAELDSLVKYWGDTGSAASHHFTPDRHTLVSYPLQSEVVGNVRPALWTLFGAVAFVLLIACVNVANLLLARAEARQREIAIRSSLGAGTGRLLRQFITEGVLMSLVGAGLGFLLALAGLQLIKYTNAGSIPRSQEIGVDMNVLLFALGISLLTGILFGLTPLFHVVLRDLHQILKNAAASSTGGGGSQIFRHILVTTEISLALVLLVGCGLMLRAFWKLQEVDIGLNPRAVLTMQINLPGSSYTDPMKITSFWTRLNQSVAELPGVTASAIATGLPPQRRVNANDTKIEGYVRKQDGPMENVDFYQAVTPSYFKTMGIQLIDGRLLNEGDRVGAPDVVVINQSMARMFYGNESPVGRRIQPGFSEPWCTIVGVVADVKNAGIDKPTGTELYLPYDQKQGSSGRNTGMTLFIRSAMPQSSLVSAVRRTIADLDPQVPISKISSMEDVISTAQARPRFLSVLLTIFSGVALVLAAVGIYGLLAYSVARRGKEFGLRMALGAQQQDVLGLVMKQGATMIASGLLTGLVAAFALTRLMSSLLFHVRATDPITYFVVVCGLAAVAFFASYIPARRATKVNPTVTLRYE
ncbi:MAG: ABC transporter permease [Acidobacteria bacterium]|nr:ABC transporter permease [Acidobacteriota bacterium]